MRSAKLCVALACAFVTLASAASHSTDAEPSDPCSRVADVGDIRMPLKTLRVAPDIAEPAIRRIDALLSTRCISLADDLLTQYVEKHPNDQRILFVYTRRIWMAGDVDTAKQLIATALAGNPRFTSMKVLSASLAIDEQRVDDAQQLLDEIEREQPNDLWLFINRLRLQTAAAPSTQATTAWFEVLDHPSMPSSARETAAQQIIGVPGQGMQQLERAYRTQLTFESATPYPTKAILFAFFLTQGQHNLPEARKVLDTVLGSQAYARRWEEARGLKADTYFIEALTVEVSDTERQDALLRQAVILMEEGWTIAEHRLKSRPDLLKRYQALMREKVAARRG